MIIVKKPKIKTNYLIKICKKKLYIKIGVMIIIKSGPCWSYTNEISVSYNNNIKLVNFNKSGLLFSTKIMTIDNYKYKVRRF